MVVNRSLSSPLKAFLVALVLNLSLSPPSAAFFFRSKQPFSAYKSPSSHTKDIFMAPRILQTSAAAQNVESSDESLSIGFLGCGMIASSIATGLATQKSVAVRHIAVSRRSASRSAALKEAYPDLISVHDDNQEILDTCDLIFVCVLPEQTSSILQSLKFDPIRHSLVSLVSTSTLEGLCQDTGIPKEQVFKMICLPSVAQCDGVSLLLTPWQRDPPVITDICHALGGCVQADNADQMSAMMVTSGLMGSFYGLLRNNREFLVRKGVSRSDASVLVASMYHNMLLDAARVQADPMGFDDLVGEQTPGGLNEQGLANIETLGVFDSYDQVQEALLSRVRGESDGSLPNKE